MIIEALHQVANHRESLSREAAREVMSEILSGGATDAQIAALLVALHMKGETVEEIVGFAEAIRKASAPLALRDSALDVSGTERDALIDTCGTGGDASGTFNISTATALTVAGAGVRVAKHGNRSVSSRCGSADVVEALGINITLPPARVAECLEAVGIAFLFAPSMHSAMKYVQPARRELRLRTVFNLLGPLCNPANASAQVVGVYSSALVDKLARAYRHGGGPLGSALSARILTESISRLAPGGRLVLYTGSAIVDGRDQFREFVLSWARGRSLRLSYEEIDPDVFGEELDQPPYDCADRIAVVSVIVDVPRS